MEKFEIGSTPEINNYRVLYDEDTLKELEREMKKEYREIQRFRNYYKKLLKGKINVSGLWRHLNSDMSFWMPVGLVNITLTDEKRSGYSSYQHARVESYVNGIVMRTEDDVKDTYLYMKTNCDDVRGIDHYYVWQTTGCCEDDYNGFLLFPLNDGTYFKVSYAC